MYFTLEIDDYTNGGPGQCNDGTERTHPAYATDLPCFHCRNIRPSECESACTKLEGCVAYDNGHGVCQLRFPSKDALKASPNPYDCWKWWDGGCENNCKTSYAGRGGKEQCWVKRKGNLTMFANSMLQV